MTTTELGQGFIGATLSKVQRVCLDDQGADSFGTNEYIAFLGEDGRLWVMGHTQDCCEDVHIEDICGELSDLVGSPIIQAEVTISSPTDSDHYGSEEWTFYRIGTAKGMVTIRWYGESNGYYSTDAPFWLAEETGVPWHDGFRKDILSKLK